MWLERGQALAVCACSAICEIHLMGDLIAHSLLAAVCQGPLTPVRLPVGKIE